MSEGIFGVNELNDWWCSWTGVISWTGSQLRGRLRFSVIRRKRRLSDADHVQSVGSLVRVRRPPSQRKTRTSSGLAANEQHDGLQARVSTATRSNRRTATTTNRGQFLPRRAALACDQQYSRLFVTQNCLRVSLTSSAFVPQWLSRPAPQWPPASSVSDSRSHPSDSQRCVVIGPLCLSRCLSPLRHRGETVKLSSLNFQYGGRAAVWCHYTLNVAAPCSEAWGEVCCAWHRLLSTILRPWASTAMSVLSPILR